jgi:hypothetical protein
MTRILTIGLTLALVMPFMPAIGHAASNTEADLVAAKPASSPRPGGSPRR